MPIDPRKANLGMWPDDVQISAWTRLHKFVYPLLTYCFLIFWSMGTLAAAAQGGPLVILLVGCFDLYLLGGSLHGFARYQFVLKEVRLFPRGIRVSNFRDELFIPYEAIEDVTQLKLYNAARLAVVVLNDETTFGRRFTFMPRDAMRFGWPSPMIEDSVVIELREPVEAARERNKAVKRPPSLDPRPGRSPMADDELDGIY